MAEVEQSGLKDPPPRWFFIRQGARDRTSCVAAQGSSVNVAASSAEAAWPAMAWPGKPHGITSTAITRLPSLRGETETRLSNGRIVPKNVWLCFKLTIL